MITSDGLIDFIMIWWLKEKLILLVEFISTWN